MKLPTIMHHRDRRRIVFQMRDTEEAYMYTLCWKDDTVVSTWSPEDQEPFLYTQTVNQRPCGLQRSDGLACHPYLKSIEKVTWTGVPGSVVTVEIVPWEQKEVKSV